MRQYIWQSKPWQAFMNFAIIFSFIVNIVLVIVLLLIAPIVLPIVGDIVNPLVGGLTESFVEMGEASIQQTIIVDDEIPIQFILPLDARTDVVLAEAVPLQVQAQFVLPNGGGIINGVVNLQLPNNLVLPVNLSLEVPVSQTVPVLLKVPVNIPLAETELGVPFNRLQSLFVPLNGLLSGLPASNEELAERFSSSD
jgi:hypothetical protein